MSSVTTNPASLESAGHRAQLVAEAVVSAYIQDISRPQRSRSS
jgi:hypothetical protein